MTTEQPCSWKDQFVTPEMFQCGDPAEKRVDGRFWCDFHWERRKDNAHEPVADTPPPPTNMKRWAQWYAGGRGVHP
jgi:hypothetical protein